jgi:hypothetical protein
MICPVEMAQVAEEVSQGDSSLCRAQDPGRIPSTGWCLHWIQIRHAVMKYWFHICTWAILSVINEHYNVVRLFHCFYGFVSSTGGVFHHRCGYNSSLQISLAYKWASGWQKGPYDITSHMREKVYFLWCFFLGYAGYLWDLLSAYFRGVLN